MSNSSDIINYDSKYICSYQFNLLSERYLFSEKSHLGMISVGVASFLLYTFNKVRTIYYKIIIGAFLILLFLNSSTLFLLSFVVSNFIIFIFNFRNFNKNSLSIYFFSILFIMLLTNSPSCSKRFSDSIKTLNLHQLAELNKKTLNKEIKKNFNNNFTTQVHIKAIMILKESIINNPFGVGFNNYFIAHKKYKNKVTSINPDADNLNVQDGTNNFVKLLTEFGLLSLFFFIVCFLFLVKKNINFELKLFLLPFLISQGLRGAGYWNGGFLFVFIVIAILLIKKWKNN